MEVTIIAAIAKNNIIGHKGKLPWSISIDWDYFLEMTKNSHVIMGYRTHIELENIGSNGWKKIIVSNPKIHGLGYDEFNVKSLKEGLKYCLSSEIKEVFIIGGQSIYEEGLSYSHKMLLTFINQEFEGDTFFPEIDFSLWELKKSETVNSNGIELTFTEWVKKL